jgi:hypothetical protein
VTKLSPQHLRALEDDRVGFLPSGIYRRSLVRVVAREVGLDPEEALRDFLREHPDDLPPPGTHPVVEPLPVPSPSWRRMFGTLGGLVPMVAGVLYFGTLHPWASDQLRPAVVEASVLPDVVPVGGFGVLPQAATPDNPITMLVIVISRCELRVIVNGTPLLGRSMEPGERFEVPLTDAVELWGDDAGAVQFSVNGRAGRQLGRSGEPLAARIERSDYASWLSRS